MSETPRVDAAAERGSDLGMANDWAAGIWTLARTLERELAAVTRERDEAYANVEDADRELKALRAEVERLRDAIKGLASRLPLLPNEPADDYVRGYSLGMRDAIKTISAALQEPTP